jgi:hypothetical protein
VGLMECIGAGFFYRFYETRNRVGLRAILTFNISFILGLILALSLSYTVSVLAGVCAGLGLILSALLISACLVSDTEMSWRSRLWWIAMSNIELMRRVSRVYVYFTKLLCCTRKGH